MLPRIEDLELRSLDIGAANEITSADADELATHLVRFEKRWPRKPLDLAGGEVTGTSITALHLVVEYLKEQEDRLLINVNLQYARRETRRRLSAARVRQLKDRGAMIMEALEILALYGSAEHLHCTYFWRFPTESVATIVQLPLIRMAIPGTPFSQITGIRFAGSEIDPLEFAVLDMQSESELSLIIRTTQVGSISPSTITDLEPLGNDLRSAFVTRVEQEEERIAP